MKLPYRCWKCWRRFSFQHPPIDRYCPVCDHAGLFLDKHRLQRNQSYRKLHLCECDGYWFPHRKGSYQCVNGGANPRGMMIAPEEPPSYESPPEEDLPF